MKSKKAFFYKMAAFTMDIICIFLAVIISLSLISTSAVGGYSIETRQLMVVLYVTLSAFMLLLFRCYSDQIKDYTLYNVLKIAGAIFSAHIAFALIMLIIDKQVPIIMLVNSMIYSMAWCGAYRLFTISLEYIEDRLLKSKNVSETKRVIIVGAGDAGKYLVSMLNQDKSKLMWPVAFIDDNPVLEGKKIKGLLVVGPRMLIPYAAKKYNAETIIIAIPFVDNSTIREIFNLCCEAHCAVKRFGNMSNLKFEGLAKSTINEVRVEDLLQRDVVRLDLESIRNLIHGKVVLVTGGAGSIGSELCKQILNYGAKRLIILDIYENALFDIKMDLKQQFHESMFEICIGSTRDMDTMDAVFCRYKPSIVFHAAAYKHVPVLEGNLREALVNNIIGTKNVVDVSVKYQVERFILISTDKAVNPSSVMGATKRIAEIMIQLKNEQSDTLFAAVRFGNVLGSNSSVVPIFQKQIRAGGPITVTHKDIKRYFMTIPEAVQLVLEAASITKGGEIFVLDMGEPVKIYDLAQTMIKLTGLEPDKDIKIDITGLRPGEKLYEELSLSAETVSKTSSKKIFLVMSGEETTQEEMQRSIDTLLKNITDKEYTKAYEQMKVAIPSFKNDLVSS